MLTNQCFVKFWMDTLTRILPVLYQLRTERIVFWIQNNEICQIGNKILYINHIYKKNCMTSEDFKYIVFHKQK